MTAQMRQRYSFLIALAAYVLGGSLQAFAGDRIEPKDQAPQQADGTWWMNASSWVNDQVPNENYDYVLNKPGYRDGKIYNDFRLGGWQNEAQNTFTGRSLQFGEVGGYAVSCILAANNMAFGCAGGGDLILASGKLASWAADTQTTILGRGGRIVVTSPEASPFWLSGAKKKSYWRLRAPLYGEAGTALKVYKEYADLNVLDFALDFDASNFNGTLIVGRPDGTRASPSYNGVNLTFYEGKSLAGKLLLNPENDLSFSSVATDYHLGALEMGAGTVMTVNNNGLWASASRNAKLSVSGACVVQDGKVTVSLANTAILGWKQGLDGLTEVPFLDVPTTATVSKNDFITTHDGATVFDNPSCPAYPRVDFVEKTNGDVKSIALRRRAFKQLEGGGAATVYLNGENDRFCWGDAEKIVDCDYFLKSGVSGLTFNTPTQESATFGGASFNLNEQGSFLQVRTRDVTIHDLRVKAGNTIVGYNKDYAATGVKLRGELGLFSSNDETKRISVGVGGWSHDLEFASTVWGDGSVLLAPAGSDLSNGCLTLSGENSRWRGCLKVDSPSSARVMLKIMSSRALGGPRSAFAADALELGRNATLAAGADGIVLDEPTRGVMVSAATAAIDVGEGKNLAIKETITYANGAVLTKRGAGELVLGGAADVMQTGTAQINVAEGCVRVLSAAALNGVTLNCSGDGAIVYSSDGTSPALIDPVLAANSTFRMTVDMTTVPQKTVTIPVCELEASKVAQFKKTFQFVKPLRGVSCMLKEEPLGNGRVRIMATVGQFGLILIFK